MSDQGGPDEIKVLKRLADRSRDFSETKGAPPCPIWPEEAHCLRILLQSVKDTEAEVERLRASCAILPAVVERAAVLEAEVERLVAALAWIIENYPGSGAAMKARAALAPEVK